MNEIRCINCGWDNPDNNEKCEKCGFLLTRAKGNPYYNSGPDINNFYMRKYVCNKCFNICPDSHHECPVCGSQDIGEDIVCKSMYAAKGCSNPACGYSTHKNFNYCPACGGQLWRQPMMMLWEDHWGYPIPDIRSCRGTLK